MSAPKQEKLAMQITERLKLPKDLTFGDAIVTVTGQHEMTVENYRGILEYRESFIRLSLKHGQLEISGKGLEIRYYTNTDMKISGRIDKIEYNS